MLYRKLDENGDYSFGRGPVDFWRDVPDAVAQSVRTRLHLEQGEWYLDSQEGTPWRTQVLGKRTENTRDLMIQMRVTETPGVNELVSYSSDLNRETRGFSVGLTIDTIYGPASLVEPL
ncbi:conserved hypothetical protein [Bosea sp. 62]|uniref:hypothetical protein n=1 Tax=unclassified Bosea (in: a-proteobacteria) TaxID=2653178 RepID=UPI001254D72D|nr:MULTISPECIES: hypothetical protein [unclassified Bosea (in: a-proteobacteria)]CAD5254446.1 conserved hypothetical protein [Bosea sp. 7B]CAD5276570.1 conserved hypothetical protein [Bosea sp. 21B]CAD5277729.1 conserved hypothetical protein [Bosea sp. 46]VVT59864.1 conserved hypothetical protein [Bosea sp. EC-HK365B]VXB46467.1 conserved hypothetical protein [Bosea sp. 62]